MKVLFVSYEVSPIYKRGGLGDVAGTLPKILKSSGVDIRIGMPAYEGVAHPHMLPGTQIPMIYVDDPVVANVQKEKKIPAKASVGFAFFCQEILKKTKKLGFQPDIIHINDWHTGLIPFLLHAQPDPFFARTRVLLTIHNTKYQGIFRIKYLLDHPKTVGIGNLLYEPHKTYVNYLRTGVQEADYISTVSPHFASEIRHKKFGFGVGGPIRKRRRKFVGILNGIDYDEWNPKTDQYIDSFDAKTLTVGKAQAKLALQREVGFGDDLSLPVFGMVARIVQQKGFDILIPVLEKLRGKSVRIVILGSGQKNISSILEKIAQKYSNYAVRITYDEKLAHHIYAGSDFFLVPSIFEPCGLTQMIAMAYGTIPVVSRVGGLVDTVDDGKTGFLLKHHSEAGLVEAISCATDVYADSEKLITMRRVCMSQKFSWEKSAKAYLNLYTQMSKK